MSRFERLIKRSSMRGFEKKLRGTEKKACKPELSAEADRLGLPRCPKCNAPLLSGFGDSSGDYSHVLHCRAAIPMDSENGNK